MAGQHRLARSPDTVISVIRRRKAAERSVAVERACRHAKIRRQKLAARSVQLVVAADFAVRRDRFFFTGTARKAPLASLARVENKRDAKTRKPHDFVRHQNVLDQQTLDVAQAHVFIVVTQKDYAPCFLPQHPLCFHAESEKANCPPAHPIPSHVDRISFSIPPLDPPEPSPPTRPTKDTPFASHAH